MSTTAIIFAEHFKNGEWVVRQSAPKKSSFCDRKEKFLEPAIDIGQSYHLFTVLAGVRRKRFENGYRTHIKPIAYPRGLPKDISPQLKSYFTEYDYYHSLSWYYVRELINFQWTKHTITKWGLVDTQFAHLFSGYERFPQDFPEEKLYLINHAPKELDTAEVSWVKDYKQFICSEYADMYDYFINSLVSLGSPKKTRIIIAFSS